MADATGIEPEEWAVWRAFLAASAQLSLEVDQRLKRDHGLNPGEYATLTLLRDAGGPLRTGELATALGWERSRMSHLLARMEERGLVSRSATADDRRASEIEVTADGRRALLAAVRSHALDVRSLFLDRMTPDERAVMTTVFTRVLNGIDLPSHD